ncbi:MAG: ribbon-helix-helix protein, CopG family [Polyangiaceae bacterium]|nr:ribbon-helix-helix protein, CopG family [Polyangiaceae bacterium]MBK8997889.1 ribbon-helix-helix protein, CopG family [Myxococcales bacterium]MCL4753288.1 ribbon-helix-helix protein, CopG family [Myxococcales bacterium]
MVEKLAISLDRELLRRAEQLRRATGESRSALVARALRQLLRAQEVEQLARDYVAAYRRVPETPLEVRAARALAKKSLARVEWDDA